MNKVVEWKNRKILGMSILYDVGLLKGNKSIPTILREMADYLEERSSKKGVKSEKYTSKSISRKLFQEFLGAVVKGSRFHGILSYLKYNGVEWVELPQRFGKVK